MSAKKEKILSLPLRLTSSVEDIINIVKIREDKIIASSFHRYRKTDERRDPNRTTDSGT